MPVEGGLGGAAGAVEDQRGGITAGRADGEPFWTIADDYLINDAGRVRLNFGASTNEARSPSPQLAPVEDIVKLSSARAGRVSPNSASAIAVAPHPRAAWNWRLLIPVVIAPSALRFSLQAPDCNPANIRPAEVRLLT